MASFSSGSFYGPPSKSVRDKQRLLRLSKAEQAVKSKIFSLRTANLDQSYPDDYHVFRTQKEALAKAQELDLSTFAFETDHSGIRSFVAAHEDKMWRTLSSLKSHLRHVYEVIPQGAPCKLYFDIEFQKSKNPGRNGTGGLATFIQFVRDQLESVLGMVCPLKDVVDLDSSSEAKFSHHVIFKTAVFENNYECGAFVQYLCNHLHPDVKEEITFLDSSNKKTLFVDGAVYTKNRNFRTFHSSKFGKTAVLELSDWSKSILDPPICDKKVFRDSLVTCIDTTGNRVLNFSGKQMLYSNLEKRMPRKSLPGQNRSEYQTSPFPEVDDYIKSLLDLPGYIRKSLWKPQEQALEYEIAGYRYCDNVQRQHKSNNIRFVVLLGRGIYFQMCHDPDCKDFKSKDYHLPKSVQPWLLLFEDPEDELDDGDENIFLFNVAEILEEPLDYENIFTDF